MKKIIIYVMFSILLVSCTNVNTGYVQKHFPTGTVVSSQDESMLNSRYLVQYPNGEVIGYMFNNRGEVIRETQIFSPVK